jgi:predicted sulfurtransferase
MEGLPVTDPNSRAVPLEPHKWRNMISEAKEKNIVVLDVRNDYEWDAGHFEGAARPNEEVFNETPVGDIPEPLKDIPSDSPVMMYCTVSISNLLLHSII